MIICFNFLLFPGTGDAGSEILSYGKQGPVYYIWAMSWLLMTWRCKEPGH